ncbi:MAG: ferritin-like domain-containing protein [Solirubrobacteraceae bacterium]
MVAGDPEAQAPLDAPQTGARSRRELLSAGALAGAAVLVTGCTSKVAPPKTITLPKRGAAVKRDVRVLNGLLAQEHRAVAAYTASIPLLPQPAPAPKDSSSPAPSAPPSNDPPPALQLQVPLASAAAARFLSQELAHVRELSGFIQQVGAHPVKPALSYDLGHPQTKQEILLLLESVEQAQLAAYLKATTMLSPGKLRAAAAAIYANHAQHISLLRFELGLRPIPSPFVTPAVESKGTPA